MIEMKLFEQEHTKYIEIIIDEMKIKEDLFYRRTTGDLVGFIDMGETINKLKDVDKSLDSRKKDQVDLAKNVLQVMVKGITSSLKFSLAFFPVNRLKGHELNMLLWEAIDILESSDIRVLVVIGDGASINRHFFKSNGEGDNLTSNYYCTNASEQEDRPLFFLFDPPHLVKTWRNNLANSAPDSSTRILRKCGKLILWDHVKKLYFLDCHRIPRRYPKLKYSHINLGSYGKMRVKFATQVASETVALGIEQEIGDEASETVKLIRLINKFFDIMNITNHQAAVRKRNPNLKPFMSPDDERLKWLETEFINYFNDWEEEVMNLPETLSNKERKMMLLSSETSEGLQMTALSMVGIIKFMLGKGAKYVLTARLNQDTLEQEFSKHRSRCGSNSNPTVAQYGQSVGKIRLLKEMVGNVKGGNTTTIEPQDAENLQNYVGTMQPLSGNLER